MVKNPPANARDTGLILGWKDPPECRQWQPTPVFLPGKFHGQRKLVGYCPWSHRDLDTTDPLSTAQHMVRLCPPAKTFMGVLYQRVQRIRPHSKGIGLYKTGSFQVMLEICRLQPLGNMQGIYSWL